VFLFLSPSACRVHQDIRRLLQDPESFRLGVMSATGAPAPFTSIFSQAGDRWGYR